MKVFQRLLADDRVRRVARTVLQLGAAALTTYAASTQFSADQTWLIGAASFVFWSIVHNYVPGVRSVIAPTAPPAAK